VCLVNRKEAENKEEIRAARSPRGFSNLDFKNEGSKSAQSHLINEIETDSIDLSRLDQTFPKFDQPSSSRVLETALLNKLINLVSCFSSLPVFLALALILEVSSEITA
jgi:hypothetical protein